MKKILMTLWTAFVAVSLFAPPAMAIDWARRQAAMKNDYTAAIEDVERNGRTPATRPFLWQLDSDKDGVIDRKEVAAVKKALSDLNQTVKAAPAPASSRPASSYGMKKSMDEKKDEDKKKRGFW